MGRNSIYGNDEEGQLSKFRCGNCNWVTYAAPGSAPSRCNNCRARLD